MQQKNKIKSIGIIVSLLLFIFLFGPIYGAIMLENRIVGEICHGDEICNLITYDIEFPEKTDRFQLKPTPYLPIPFDPGFSYPPPLDPDSITQFPIDTSLDPLDPEDISFPSAPEEPIENPFTSIIESIKDPTLGNKGGSTPPPTPPIITDCTPTQTVNQILNIQCYKGRRTYNTMLLQVQNMNPTNSCKLELDIAANGGPALEDYFTTGNADIWLTLSSVDPLSVSLTEYPNPRNLGSWTQWHNNPLQVELVNGTLQTATPSTSITVPAGESRNIGMVVDCGYDTIIGENGIIRVQTNFTN